MSFEHRHLTELRGGTVEYTTSYIVVQYHAHIKQVHEDIFYLAVP